MKVKMVDFEEGVMAFLKRIVATMPTTGHKWVAGAMLASSAKRIETALGGFVDEEGFVDTAKMREAAMGGFSASGEKVSFTVGDDSLKWLISPVTVSITQSDIMTAMDEIDRKYGR